jgi:hypothetical protein
MCPLQFHSLAEKESRLKTKHSRKPSKDEAILVSLAESIGSTLGSIAAKADATQKALTGTAAKASRKGKALRRKGKAMLRGLKKTKVSRPRRRHSAHRTRRVRK